MLARQVFGYIPSLVIPAVTAFGAIFCYTRLLSPEEYGRYALALNTMTLFSAVFFSWLQTTLLRLMPQAIREGRERELRATTYVSFAVVSLALALGVLVVTGLVPLGDLGRVAWLAMPLTLARALLYMNQAFHRSQMKIARYNVIECGQAALGFLAGVGLVYFLHLGSKGAVLGMIAGMGAMALIDLRALLSASLKDFNRAMLMEIIRFGLPLIATYGLFFIVSSAGPFMIEHFQGAAQVGFYAAGYTPMDRINTILFMMIATPSYPLTMHKLEHEGYEAAREQTYNNGVAVLFLAFPACVGMMLANQQLAAVLIGGALREGALRVMPFTAVSSFMCGLATHYFDNAFHLAKKPYLLFMTQGPAAAVNLVLNILLIPRFGYMGAVYASFVSFILLLTLSISVGRRVFPIKFPFKPALQIAGATGLMAAVISFIRFPTDILGLSGIVMTGVVTYAIGILVFDVVGAREKVRSAYGLAENYFARAR